MVTQTLHLSWFNPVQIELGSGCRKTLIVDQAVVVLADANALSAVDQSQLRSTFGEHCKTWEWVSNETATTTHAVRICQNLWPVMRRYPSAIVIAIGGGTPIDLAKVVRYRFLDLQSSQWPMRWQSDEVPDLTQRHPLWALPTKAGTGSTHLFQVFQNPAGAECLQLWLNELGVNTRELRDQPSGRATLAREMQSTRGRNFIAAQP